MKYSIEIAANAEKFLEHIPKRDIIKIIERIDSLEIDPLPPWQYKT